MWPFSSQVLKKLHVCAARVGEGVREDGETGRVEFAAGKQAVIVSGLGEAVVPGEQERLDGRGWPEGRAEDVSKQPGLCLLLSSVRLIRVPHTSSRGGEPSPISHYPHEKVRHSRCIVDEETHDRCRRTDYDAPTHCKDLGGQFVPDPPGSALKVLLVE